MEWVFLLLGGVPLLVGAVAAALVVRARPRKARAQLPPSYLTAANAGVLHDRGATEFHFRARRGERLINVFRDGEELELYVDLEVSPNLELALRDAATLQRLEACGAPGAFTVDLTARRLVLRGAVAADAWVDSGPLVDAIDDIATRVEARHRLEPCPRCFDRAFEPGAGPLHEDLCHHCGGRFFGPTPSRELFSRLGLETAALQAAVDDAPRTGACPACGQDLRRAALEYELELCPGCGSAWAPGGASEVLRRAGLVQQAKQG